MEVELTTEYSDSQLSESIKVEKLGCPHWCPHTTLMFNELVTV